MHRLLGSEAVAIGLWLAMHLAASINLVEPWHA